MTTAYNDALKEQARKNLFENLVREASSLDSMQKAQLVADVAGFFDPSPTCDLIGMGLSLVQGDFVGAGLSALGAAVPYLGDVAKLGKVAKVAPRAAGALETLAKHGDALARASRETLQQAGLTRKQVATARTKALSKVRDDMKAAKAAGKPGCTKCPVEAAWAKRKLQMPGDAAPNGSWVGGKQPPPKGKGTFEFAEAKTLPKKLADGTKKVKTIEFDNGAPVLDKYVEGGKHHLWVVTGDATKDAKELTRMMREKNENWMPPLKEDFVLHHFENGQVGYVPRVLHDKDPDFGGVAHTGGNSMINNATF
jgi:hypothetical protein